MTSDKCALSLVLFDEIEKAAPSLTRLLLGVLDKGVLRLGDNSTVNFEKSLVFLTSNLGAREMMKEINPDFGFQAGRSHRADGSDPQAAEHRAGGGAQEVFSRVREPHRLRDHLPAADRRIALRDSSITRSLDLQNHVNTRLANRCFTIEVPFETRQWFIKHGTSSEYGARELNRTIHRNLTQPLATMVATNQIDPASRVRVEPAETRRGWISNWHDRRGDELPSHPTVLLVDDNRDLLHFLERLMAEAGWKLLPAESAGDARKIAEQTKPNAALLDYMLPDGNGVELGVQLRAEPPRMQVIVMTGSVLPPEEEAICEEHDFPGACANRSWLPTS